MSYADMITILMAFFVVMYSMAGAKDEKKEEAVMASLRMALGGIAAPWPDLHAGANMQVEGKGTGPRAGRSSIPSNLRKPTMAGNVFYFNAVDKDLNEQDKERVRMAAESLAGKRHMVEIRGRPSRRPLPQGVAYHDQVELTFAKCRQMRDYLIDLGIEAERIQLHVATASAPGGTTDDPQLLNHDARVDVLLLGQFLDSPKSVTGPGRVSETRADRMPSKSDK